MTEPGVSPHVREAQRLSQTAAFLEGGMLVFNAIPRGDTLSAVLLAEWLRDSVRQRLLPDAAEAALADVARKIRGERAR
jgi:hypothetical protein